MLMLSLNTSKLRASEAWLWMLNGDRVNQMSRWITNRLAYLDSKYDYNTDDKTITARFDIWHRRFQYPN